MKALDRKLLVESNILPNEKPELSEEQTEEKNSNEWSESMTRTVLDKYDEYIGDVGPMKKFRTKKRMWEFMAEELNNMFENNKTAQQVENRFKTVLKRKKNATVNNHQSGSKRTKIEFEEELNKIASKDDSIEPEILKDQNSTIQVHKDIIKAENKKSVSLTDVFNKAQEAKLKQRDQQHKEREDNKERRHQEKLQLLKDLFKNS